MNKCNVANRTMNESGNAKSDEVLNNDTTRTIDSLLEDLIQPFEQSLRPILQSLSEWSSAAAPFVAEFRKWNQSVDALNKVGWLPYRSTPIEIFEECADDPDLLDVRLSKYYRSHWHEIRQELESRIVGYSIDDEARTTFCEAITNHEAGRYRSVCRLLFPEIERVIGAESVKSKEILKKLTGTRDLGDFVLDERFAWVVFGRVVQHIYEFAPPTDGGKFAHDYVPNRHAALHGFVSYNTQKHSMNMLILTDYIFSIVCPTEESAS